MINSIEEFPDLSTPEAVLQFYAEAREWMAERWRENGRFESNGFSFEGWTLATHRVKMDPANPMNWVPGEPYGKVVPLLCRLPGVISLMFPDESGTRLFGQFLKKYAAATKAVGTIVMGEAWMVEFKSPEGQPPMTKEEAEAEREKLPESLEHAEGRKEHLFCALEHVTLGKKFWTAEIERNPDLLMPWKDKEMEQSEGRLCDTIEGVKDADTNRGGVQHEGVSSMPTGSVPPPTTEG